MSLRMDKVNLYRTKCFVNFPKTLLRSMFILLYFNVRLVLSNKDIPVCHKLWNKLGNDMHDWRERCLDKDEEIYSLSCQAEKDYFEERRRNHKKMCFYEGK